MWYNIKYIKYLYNSLILYGDVISVELYFEYMGNGRIGSRFIDDKGVERTFDSSIFNTAKLTIAYVLDI
jgi:hypothetical protein